MFLTFFGDTAATSIRTNRRRSMLVPLAVLARALARRRLPLQGPRVPEQRVPRRWKVPENTSLMVISRGRRPGRHRARLAACTWPSPAMADSLADSFKGLYTLVYNKYFVDEIYDAAVVKPVVAGSRVVLWKGVDAGLIDGIVNGVGARARGIRRRAAAAAVRQHPQLRHLGAVRLGGADRGAWASREACDEPPDCVVLFLPLAGFLAALAIPRSSPHGSRVWALGGLAGRPSSLSLGLLAWLRPRPGRRAVRHRRALDRLARHPLRHLASNGVSLWLILLSTFLTPICVLISWRSHPGSREGVLRLPAAAGIRADRRLPGAGPVPVLRLLGSLAGAHVFPDRHLGPRAPHLRRRQVLPLHHGRLGADAGRHHLPLQRAADVQLPGDPRDARQRHGWPSRRASRCCCSWPSSSPSPSRCRSSRCTPGCPTRTWRRPRPAP